MNGAWHWVSCLEKKPEKRKEEDLDIIYCKLKSMPVFENYPNEVLQELNRYALYDSFLANITLFRPGDRGLYWYAVISGSLEMLDVDPSDSSKTTSICQLRYGDSFGENIIFGKNRQTMIVTTEYCELLCVEAEHMRRIYEAHKGVMERLLHLGSYEQEPHQEPNAAVETSGLDMEDGEQRDSLQPDSELAMAGVALQQLIQDHFIELFSDHRVNLFTYRRCCSGRKLVDWVVAQSSVSRTRVQVVQIWQALLTEGIIQHVHKEYPFRDDPQLYYQFVDQKHRGKSGSPRRWSAVSSRSHGEEDGGKVPNGRPRSGSSVTSSPRSSRSSITSLLEECFDTITQLGPEALIYAILMKEPSERTEDEVELIFEELLHVRAFRHLSNAVKRQIAACVRLEHFQKAGKFLFHQGDKGDSWYIILKGSVNVIIRGKGVVCTLHEGDEFGKLALVNEGVRSASIQAREANCYFLRIERDDFRRILLNVESTTVKLKEHGREVMLLERSTLGKYLVVKGTPDKMLGHLLEMDSDEDGTFAADFFLTYPSFMSIQQLCDGLMKRYHSQTNKKGTAGIPNTSPEQETIRKKRLAEIVRLWIKTAKAELVKDATFLKLLRELQDCLAKDNLTEEMTLLNSSISDSIRGSGGFGSSLLPSSNMGNLRAFPIIRCLITDSNQKTEGEGLIIYHPRKGSHVQDPEIKMGICALPPCQPQDKVPLRVHTIDLTCCRLQVRLDATARSIVTEACSKLHLNAAMYDLCEVKSSGEKVVLRGDDISVHSEMSVNGRLYIVPRTHSEKTLPPLPDQNQKPVVPFPERDGSREIAAHLTMYDWNLFSNIQQMEFIHQVFGRHKFGKITTNLDLIIRRFNEVQYWVVTEMCREPDLIKRVVLLKKFIKIAGHCKEFCNLNSFFAITVGLMNGAVTRLHLTWKELTPRLKRRFEQFEALTDPSRNHKVLRAYQSKLAPPLIPFIPLVMKDAYFLHEGNETFVDKELEMVNFEKMRLVASKVRCLNEFRSGSLSPDIRLLANKNPSLQQYIRTLHVIDNQRTLTQMSHKVEPSVVRPLSTA